MKNIALCLFGQPRYIESTDVFDSHKKYIFKQGKTDVFAHMWFDKNQKTFEQSEWSYSENLKSLENTLDLILNRYTPKKLLSEPQKQFVIDNEIKDIVNSFPNQEYNKDQNIFNILSQLYSIKKSIELYEGFVEETKSVYDYVILTRYDVIIRTFPDLNTLKNKYYIGGTPNIGGYYPGFNDYLHIMQDKHIKGVKAYDRFKECLSRCESLCIEEIKQIHFADNFIYPKELVYIGEKMFTEIKRFL